jgi:uncharacterized membrane protein
MGLRQKDIALVVSILVNVFLVGAAITVYALHVAGAPANVGQRSSMRAAASSLDQSHRAAFMQLLHRQGKAIQAETRSAKAIRDEAWASLDAGTFDPVSTKRRLAEARELNLLARTAIEDAVVDFAVGLTPAQRANFSVAMRRGATRQRTDTSKERTIAR